MAMYLAGIDIGTSGAKGMVFDLQGNVPWQRVTESIPAPYLWPGWVERDAKPGLRVDNARQWP